jgi:penicillin-binding protein 2
MEQNVLRKKKAFQWLITIIFCVLILRLGYLQILNASAYQTKAEQNQFRMLPIFAPRGDIIDRDGEVLSANQIVNTVSIIRHQTDEETLEQTIKKVAALLNDLYPEINADYIQALLDEHQERLYEPVVIKRDIPIEVVARLEERREELPGVVIDQYTNKRILFKKLIFQFPHNVSRQKGTQSIEAQVARNNQILHEANYKTN